MLLAEEILPLAVRGKRNPQWDRSEAVRKLFDIRAIGNIPINLAQKVVGEAVDYIRDNASALEDIAVERAKDLLAEHTKVKEFTSEGSASEVAPCLPVDVMGVFVLLPADE